MNYFEIILKFSKFEYLFTIWKVVLRVCAVIRKMFSVKFDIARDSKDVPMYLIEICENSTLIIIWVFFENSKFNFRRRSQVCPKSNLYVHALLRCWASRQLANAWFQGVHLDRRSLPIYTRHQTPSGQCTEWQHSHRGGITGGDQRRIQKKEVA